MTPFRLRPQIGLISVFERLRGRERAREAPVRQVPMSIGPDNPPPRPPPAPTATPDLPPAELRRRRRELMLAAGVIAAIVGVVLFERRMSGAANVLPAGDSLLFLFLNALNVILIVLLVFLISRNLVKLVF